MASTLIFDLDGTLIDSREDLAYGVNLMRAEYGLDILPVETVVSYIGNGARKLVERSLHGLNISVEEALPKMKSFYMQNLIRKTHPYQGVEEGLRKLHEKGFKLALVSNKQQKATEAILTHFKFSHFFSCVIGGDNKFPLKPDPASLIYVLDLTGGTAAESWMIGDNYTDLESGRKAGMKTCFAKYGFGNKREESYTTAVNSFAEFVELALKQKA